MPTFLQPDPVILAFFGLKQVFYLEVVALFALIRVPLCAGQARRAAMVALVLVVAALAAKLLPPILGLSSGPLFLAGGWVRASLGGMTVPLMVSGLLLAAAVLPGRRYWGLDLVHAVWFAALLGLWAYTAWA